LGGRLVSPVQIFSRLSERAGCVSAEPRPAKPFRILNSRMKMTSLARWTACVALALLSAKLSVAAETDNQNISRSAHPPARRAAWQQKLTLGPGDVLNISLFDRPETARTEVSIAPDGRLSFLRTNIMAAGLTIDELRGNLDQALRPFYQDPRTIITPAAIHSKKYIVLGSIVNRGVFPFDRPLTLIEAIARSGGLETGVYDQHTVELADLPRSFVVRNGKRVPVDFEKLFARGDLSQNIPLEPDDFLYFASARANEIYVLGEVMRPGIMTFPSKPTALKAIASRGGYTTRAFKSRVLVVRGSLDHPKTFIVDTRAVLSGKEPDFQLQPRDIVYVSSNPWKVAGELVDIAARAFVQGFVVEAATLHVGPIITSPLIR
jgi:protein involved in polysaccharide export with SLBB domain